MSWTRGSNVKYLQEADFYIEFLECLDNSPENSDIIKMSLMSLFSVICSCCVFFFILSTLIINSIDLLISKDSKEPY